MCPERILKRVEATCPSSIILGLSIVILGCVARPRCSKDPFRYLSTPGECRWITVWVLGMNPRMTTELVAQTHSLDSILPAL